MNAVVQEIALLEFDYRILNIWKMNKQGIIFLKSCMCNQFSFQSEKKKSKFDSILWLLQMCFLCIYTENAYVFV